jgi:hypothetical protein
MRDAAARRSSWPALSNRGNGSVNDRHALERSLDRAIHRIDVILRLDRRIIGRWLTV